MMTFKMTLRMTPSETQDDTQDDNLVSVRSKSISGPNKYSFFFI